MDNEPEIWSGTHDDVMTSQLAATAFMDKYFAVAKKARALYPNIKLCGPVCANEWQWYKWGSETLYINGKYYSWMEYFLKRVADEQKATGIRLLDVVDIHWYPGESANADVVQLYRIFYDKTYVYPGANGIKSINGGWDTSQNKEYIFQRISDWLTTYFGTNHGIGLGLSESGINTTDANVNSVLYASMLGTFANNGVEYFTPWTWNTGMYETLHLFSRYAKSYSVSSTSTVENTVSAYSTVTSSADSMTVMLLNRDVSASHSVKVNLSAFSVNNGSFNTLQIASLPTTETFVSHSNNALKKSTVTVSNNSFTITLPAMSTTAVILKAATTDVAENTLENSFTIYPNPVSNHLNAILPGTLNGNISWKIYSTDGRLINGQQLDANAQSNLSISTSSLQNGMYLLTIQDKQTTLTKRFCVKK